MRAAPLWVMDGAVLKRVENQRCSNILKRGRHHRELARQVLCDWPAGMEALLLKRLGVEHAAQQGIAERVVGQLTCRGAGAQRLARVAVEANKLVAQRI